MQVNKHLQGFIAYACQHDSTEIEEWPLHLHYPMSLLFEHIKEFNTQKCCQ
jgi:hypothetical protein